MENIVAGVDIGGTHITVGLVDLDKGEVITGSIVRRHIDPSGEAAAIISEWAGAIQTCHRQAEKDIDRIGIAMPGPFDYENGISLISGLHKYENLYGLNVKELLAVELGILPDKIRMMNDASAFLLGELRCGCGRGYDNVAGITLGTGLGSASFYDNRIHDGDLYCFAWQGGTAEDLLCSRWFVREYEKATGKKIGGVKEIAAEAVDDTQTKELFDRFGYTLGEVLAARYTSQSPAAILIGGNIAHAWELFMPALQRALADRGCAFSLRRAALGEAAALAGASYAWE